MSLTIKLRLVAGVDLHQLQRNWFLLQNQMCFFNPTSNAEASLTFGLVRLCKHLFKLANTSDNEVLNVGQEPEGIQKRLLHSISPRFVHLEQCWNNRNNLDHQTLCHSHQSIFTTNLFKRKFTARSFRSTRSFHSQTEFTLQNDTFAKYIATLVDEYNSYYENAAHNKKTEDAQILRLQFLRPVITVIGKLQAKEADIKELAKLAKDEQDQEMTAMIAKEIKHFQEEMKDIEDELVDALVGEDLADNNDIVLEVSAGVGGQEAMLFCAEVFNMYCNFAHYKGWTFGGISEDEAEYGGFRKSSMEISGEAVYKHLKHEAGVHRVQRVPKTERQGRIHTSTITVAVVPKPKEIDIVLDPKDLKFEAMRASGPGGQSVNTANSAVRITHLPTGTVAECREERSQIKNKDIAIRKLKLRMSQVKLDEQEAKRRATRKMQVGCRGRSEKIRTYNFQQDRISDHRVKGNVNNIQEFMHGGEALQDLIHSLEQEDRYSALRSMIQDFELSLTKKSGKS